MVSPGPVVFKEALKLKRKSFKEAELEKPYGAMVQLLRNPAFLIVGGGGGGGPPPPPQLNRSSD